MVIASSALAFPQTKGSADVPGITETPESRQAASFLARSLISTSCLTDRGLTVPPEPGPDSRHCGWKEVTLSSCPQPGSALTQWPLGLPCVLLLWALQNSFSWPKQGLLGRFSQPLTLERDPLSCCL